MFYNGEITFHLKRVLKKLCYYWWKNGLITIMHQTFFWRAGYKGLAMLIWKWKGSFQVHDLVHDFWKKCLEVHVSLLSPKVPTRHTTNCVPNFPILSALKKLSLVGFFLDKHVGRNFKTSLKENCVITLDSRYLFIKISVEKKLDIDSAYRVWKHQTFLKFTTDLLNIFQFKQILNMTVC